MLLQLFMCWLSLLKLSSYTRAGLFLVELVLMCSMNKVDAKYVCNFYSDWQVARLTCSITEVYHSDLVNK